VEFSIKGPRGNVIATGLSACETRCKFLAGRRLFGGQAIFGPNGVLCSEQQLEFICALEDGGAPPSWLSVRDPWCHYFGTANRAPGKIS